MKPNEVAILKNTITKEQYRNLLSDLQTNAMIVEFISSITEYCVKKSIGEPGNLTNWVLIEDHERLDVENQKMRKTIIDVQDALSKWNTPAGLELAGILGKSISKKPLR